jgi:putative FmdB family regulatory protein
MPIYEYQCTACSHQLEAFQKFSDAQLTECPVCQQPTLTKLVSATAFHLKGTGWYVTDTRDKGKPKPKAAETDSGSTSSTETSVDKTPPPEKKAE